MKYLDSDYRLHPANPSLFALCARMYGAYKQTHDLTDYLRLATLQEDPDLIDVMRLNMDNVHNTYGGGSAYYGMSFGIGLTALREMNPSIVAPPIGPNAWEDLMAREYELRSRPGLSTLHEISGIALLEVAEVNPGYVDGFQEAFDTPGLSQYLGFTGLGTLHAHDLLHFASTEQ